MIERREKVNLGKMSYTQYGGGYDDSELGYDQQQRAPPSQYNIRPVVDPEAEGEVDPNQ